LLVEFTKTQMLFWACWWVASNKDRYSMHGKVSKAIMRKLREAIIALPYRSGNVNVKVNSALETIPKTDEP